MLKPLLARWLAARCHCPVAPAWSLQLMLLGSQLLGSRLPAFCRIPPTARTQTLCRS